ncbi:MAG: S8 family peptidase [Bacteroidota bacterium]
MRFIISVLFFLFVSIFAFGQGKLSSKDRNDIASLRESIVRNNGLPTELHLNKLPIQKINGVHYLNLLGEINSNFDQDCLKQKNWIAGKPIGQVSSVKVPLSDLAYIETAEEFDFLEIAGKIRNQLDKAVIDMRADSVQLGIGLPEAYTGKDVYIGITDWGFDYTSPMFYDTALQQTRIVAAWDQFKTSGPSPINFEYGTEYNTPAELLTAGSDTSNIYSYATHGTHVSGIAGGSGAGTPYRGVAFESKFLFVTFLVDVAAVLDAWEWMYQKAQADGKRLVVNMSWGLYHFGTLDGTSLLSQAITAYTDLGVVFANSAGNNGNVNFHIKKTFNNETIKSKIDFYSYSANANMWGQSIHSWGEAGKSFSNGIIVANSSNVTLVESPFYSTDTTSSYIDTFLVTGADTIWYNISADSAHSLNNRPTMRLRVKNTNTALKVILKSTAASGTVHYWNVTELSNDVGNWGMPFTTAGTGTIAGDNLNGISEPSCSDDVISVAAYATQYQTSGTSTAGGAIASFSSYGPRYDGVMKPDITAPGVNIISSMSSYTDVAFTSQGSVAFNGRTYHFAKLSGTSMASPMVAGVSALILDANPYLSARQVKEIIMQSARQDNFTGTIPPEGSPKWGAGKINAYAAVKLALETVGLENPPQELMWSVYPNPVMNELHFTIVEELPKTVDIFDIAGNYFEKPIINGKVYVSDLTPGQYFIRILIDGKVQQDKFIKQ